jgi:hypothetical protein
MRINTSYSKWSVWLLITAFLSLGIINYLFFATDYFFFEDPFVLNVYLFYIISVEVFTGLSRNRVLKTVSYLLTMGLCGFTFIVSIFNILGLWVLLLVIKEEWIPVHYIILMLCSGTLSFSAAVSLLKLFSDWNE